MNDDVLGDRCKAYEELTESKLMPYLPTIARLDGRAFHTLTRSLEKPFDGGFTDLMVNTAKSLMEEFDPLLGYVQSDEISLLFYQKTPLSQMLFGGRVQKLCSILAAAASAYFNLRSPYGRLAQFDCRVFQVPSMDEAANCLLWRERDAVRNSILGAANALLGHAACLNKNTSELQEMMFQKGVNWNDYEPRFKMGTYLVRNLVEKPFSPDEISKLPPQHNARTNPNLVVKRHEIQEIHYGAREIINRWETRAE